MGWNTAVGGLRISTSHIVLEYDLVFDCKAEIISGNGISSVTPSANQEVVEGESCTFTATLESSEWVFVGWYSSSDFSGSPESTSLSYTKTITENTTLYPKAIHKNNIHIYGNTDRFTYVLSSTSALENAQVTLTVTPTNSIYQFSSIYVADVNGNKTAVHISNDNPYTFTMPDNDVYLYVEVGKKVNVYVNCQNCQLSTGTSPIESSGGKTETITITYDSENADWSGIYSDKNYTNKVSDTTTYTFMVDESDVYLYAKAISKQQIYVKENGVWEAYSKVYVKENGTWVEKTDPSEIFDIIKKYKRVIV